ncbi:MAG: GatB/YqeY domain-containing protein [Candidatus Woykebacteria bacterium]
MSDAAVKIQNDLKQALRNKDDVTVSTLRLLVAAIKNFEIAKGGAGYKATEEDIISVLQKEVKQRKESIEQYKSGGRQDLVEKEKKELEILERYLPDQLSEEEVEKIVKTKIQELGVSSLGDMGKIMGVLSQELKGKADLTLVASLVKRSLGS